jgi:glycosyltransferase involved in cell wall biosynthesis
MKYFVSKGYEVLSIVFYSKTKQRPIPGVKIIQLPHKPLLRIPFFKRFLYGSNIRKITAQHKPDILYVINALNSYYLKKSKAKKNFLEIQGSDVILAPKWYPFLKRFYRHYWKYADGSTQDSQIAKENAGRYMPVGMINETIEIGIDFTIFNDQVEDGWVRKKYQLKKRPIIFHSRSLTPIYNVDTIIKSIPIVKNHFEDVCFMFAGSEESLDKESKDFIRENQLEESIIFCGWIDHQSEMKYYNKDADILVSIPSSDSSPFSVYEAMATKTPVIVTELPWYEGKFIPGKHLLCIPVKDVDALGNTIISLLKKEVAVNVDDAYAIIYKKINMISENSKLEKMFLHSLNDKN